MITAAIQAMQSSLQADVKVFRGQLPGAIVIMSGVHGVEGYGSELVQDEIESKLKQPHPTLFMVRKVNAWGYQHKERFTEKGVDLNRAGTQSPPINKGYRIVKEVVNHPHNSVASLEAKLLANAAKHPILLAPEIEKAGNIVKAMTHAIMSGQKDDPDGFEYRGQGVAAELTQLGNYLKKLKIPDGPLIVWDIHTGVGEPGTGDILICDTDNERELLLAALPPGGDSARRIRQGGKGVYLVHGSAMGAIYRMLKDSSKPRTHDVVVTQEFATKPEKETLLALINKHAGKPIDLKPFFYIDDDTWRTEVRRRGLQLYTEFLAHMSVRLIF